MANDGRLALAARKVTAINTATGARFDVSTTTTGGYTVSVPKGMYRMEVELRNGETLATQPDATESMPATSTPAGFRCCRA